MTQIFCVQDKSGTVYQATLADAALAPIEVGDTGTLTGYVHGAINTLAFTVSQVNNQTEICITTVTPNGARGEALTSNWPSTGTITWITGANTNASPAESLVTATYPSNAYIDLDFLATYAQTFGGPLANYPDSPIEAVQQAIAQATAYIDARYRFKGTKLQAWLLGPGAAGYLDLAYGYGLDFGWFAGMGGVGGGVYGVGGYGSPMLLAAATMQRTEWPRAGLVDNNGDIVFGVSLAVQQATAECALRVLNGTVLQPDYDPTITANGGVIESVSTQVGPINTRVEYDVRMGLGFFASIPVVDRLLKSNGLILAGGGRTICR